MRGLRGVAITGRGVAALMGVAALGVVGCKGSVGDRSRPDGPGWRDSAAIAAVDSATLARYVAKLEFDTTDGVWDEQRLMVLDDTGKRHGALVRIEPEVRSGRLSRREVERGATIARITVRAPDERTKKKEYATLGIFEDTSFLYVFKLETRGAREGTWHAVILGQSARFKQELQLDVQTHKRRYPELALARWVWSETDEHIWGTCGPDCCSVSQLTLAAR